MLKTCYTSKKPSCFLLQPFRNFAWAIEGFLECLDFTPSKIFASDVTSWRYSRFQGKMNIPGYQFRDSLQFLPRKMWE